MSISLRRFNLNLVDSGEHWKTSEQGNVISRSCPQDEFLTRIRGREPADGSGKEVPAVFYTENVLFVFKIGFVFGV